mgnify:FL=1
MAKRNFDEWLGTFRESINGFKYYTDFETVYKNAEKYKIELNILNSLVGSQTIKKDFTNLIEKYPECLKAIPLLLAVRENEMYCQDEIVSKNFAFHEPYDEITDYIYFMEHTGLFDLIQNHLVSNLYDYVTGVEVGLGSNGRKNRGGHQMEDLVEGFIKETVKEYYKEMYLQDIEKKRNIDLSSISANNTTTKRWDFVVKTENHIYVIETNFYAAGGSKLNETARSYKMIAEESKNIKNFSFVWITDGGGWRSARRNLEETFNVLDNLYNIYDLESLVLEKLFG